MRYVVALVGNPNVGKSVIFNSLTGGKAWVGNWPGVTVEKKVGRFRFLGREFEVVDLPGIYGLSAYSIDERIARDFIVEERPDVVLNIVNASNLTKDLYLTVSLLEAGARLVVVLNMMDLAEDRGMKINVKALRRILGVPVVPTIATKGVGLEAVKRAILSVAESPSPTSFRIGYGRDVEAAIDRIEGLLKNTPLAGKYPLRWLAIRLLEGDTDYVQKVREAVGEEVCEEIRGIRSRLAERLGADPEDAIVERRHAVVMDIVSRVVETARKPSFSMTEVIDYVVTHKVFGIPILLTMLYFAFRIAFDLTAPLVDAIDLLFSDYLTGLVEAHVGSEWLRSLLSDGILNGLGTLLVFLPNIAFFFLLLSAMEDLGYMTRVAFIMDKVMYRLGLSGKSIIPIILGVGCNVPAIMATRNIEDERDRKVTAMVLPLVPCSARLPIFLLFSAAFFSSYRGAVIASMYVIAIAVVALVANLFRRTAFKGPTTGFIMEMPPYMLPVPRNVLMKTWIRTRKFLEKAGTVIFGSVIVIWLMSVTGPSGYIGPGAFTDPGLMARTWVAWLGMKLEPFLRPLGWDWRLGAALIYGFLAKEVVVSTLSLTFGKGGVALMGELTRVLQPHQAFAFMVFSLTYVPCIPTIAAIRSELGTKYALFTVLYQMVLAYILALLVVAIGGLIF